MQRFAAQFWAQRFSGVQVDTPFGIFHPASPLTIMWRTLLIRFHSGPQKMSHFGNRWQASVCAALIVMASLARGQESADTKPEPSDAARRFLAYVDRLRAKEEGPTLSKISAAEQRAKTLTDELTAMKTWKVSKSGGKQSFKSTNEKRNALFDREYGLKETKEELDKLNSELAKMRKSVLPQFERLGSFDVGNFGTLSGWQTEVEQIIDGQTMLVEIRTVRYLAPPVNRALEVGSREAFNAQQQSQFGIQPGRPATETGPAQFVLVKGLATQGFADGKRLEPSDVFEVTGTKRIRGTQTVYVLERVDVADAMRFAPKLDIPPEPSTPAEPATKKPKEITIEKGKVKLGGK